MPGAVQTTFDNHPVHQALIDCSNQLTEIGAADSGVADIHVPEYLDAIRAMVDYATISLSRQDARLVTSNMLDPLSNAAASLAPHLNRVKAEPTPPNAQAALEAAGVLVSATSLFPRPLDGSAAKIAQQVASPLRKELATALSTSKEAAERSESLLAKVTAAALSAEESVANSGATATAAVTSVAEASTAGIMTATTTFEATTQQLETQRTAALTQINEAMTGMEARFASAEKTRAEAAGASLRAATDQQTNLLDQITETEAKAEEALRLAGGAALSKRWIDQADYQRKERYFWVFASLGLVLLTLLLGILKLRSLTAPSDTGALGAVIFYFPQIPFAAASLTGIGFCISQASRRGLWEARDRRVANELTALPSFMAGMADDARKELMREVALRYFPGPEVSHDEPVREEKTPVGTISGGFYALVGSISTAALVLGAALVIALTK